MTSGLVAVALFGALSGLAGASGSVDGADPVEEEHTAEGDGGGGGSFDGDAEATVDSIRMV